MLLLNGCVRINCRFQSLLYNLFFSASAKGWRRNKFTFPSLIVSQSFSGPSRRRDYNKLQVGEIGYADREIAGYFESRSAALPVGDQRKAARAQAPGPSRFAGDARYDHALAPPSDRSEVDVPKQASWTPRDHEGHPRTNRPHGD